MNLSIKKKFFNLLIFNNFIKLFATILNMKIYLN